MAENSQIVYVTVDDKEVKKSGLYAPLILSFLGGGMMLQEHCRNQPIVHTLGPGEFSGSPKVKFIMYAGFY